MEKARLWWQKWRWYERNSLPWNRIAIHREWPAGARSSAGRCTGTCSRRFAKAGWRWASTRCSSRTCGSPPPMRAGSGSAQGSYLNIGVMVAAGAGRDRRPLHVRQRLLRDRREPPLRRPGQAGPLAGLHHQGAARVGDNVWCGANVVITSGVTVGERCVIGANSVVTEDIPPYSIAAGAPAKVLRRIEYPHHGAQHRTIRWNGLSTSAPSAALLGPDATPLR